MDTQLAKGESRKRKQPTQDYKPLQVVTDEPEEQQDKPSDFVKIDRVSKKQKLFEDRRKRRIALNLAHGSTTFDDTYVGKDGKFPDEDTPAGPPQVTESETMETEEPAKKKPAFPELSGKKLKNVSYSVQLLS